MDFKKYILSIDNYLKKYAARKIKYFLGQKISVID